MKIYTKTGDDGSTGLFGGKRLGKDAARIEVYGTVDELNATIGLVRAASPSPSVDAALGRIQEDLFSLGGELAMAPVSVGTPEIERLESEIDGWEKDLDPLKNFILPGGTTAAAALHLARTVARRAERQAVALSHREPVRADLLVYLNRLSDHLFVAARACNRAAGVADVPWRPSSAG